MELETSNWQADSSPGY